MAYLTQQELCNAVFASISQAENPVSRLEICRSIGKKKGAHIIRMIEHLVDTGYVAKCWSETKFKKPVLVYFLPEKRPEGLPCREI